MDATDAELPTQNAEGVDLTLVRWMLTLTPAERVEWVEGIAQFVATEAGQFPLDLRVAKP